MNGLLEPIPEFRIDAGDVPRRLRHPDCTRIDLHCHSTFSNERIKYLPGILYHPLLEPAESYDLARRRGMDFVTLTDHDTIDGCKALLDQRGELPDFIVGEEVSVAFPDDGTIVHVNVYDIDEAQHRELQRVRLNIFDFADYCRRIDKLFVLNHMTWNQQHRVLSTRQIEVMLDLFPAFEGLNGTRSYAHNAFAWYATRSAGKTLVAGSDSHTDRVGTTYTLTHGATRAAVIAAIRAGDAAICGAFGTAEKLAEDVWTLVQKNFERRMTDATSLWQRAVFRAARHFGRFVYPLVCSGYHKHQNVLIRDFVRALPA